MKKRETIKVDKTVMPIHFSQRTQVELVVGNDYFVSFGNNEAIKCTLTKVYMQGDNQMIEIEFTDDQTADNDSCVSRHALYANEIGLTPEEAVINEVTM